jgi:hypothetical protein
MIRPIKITALRTLTAALNAATALRPHVPRHFFRPGPRRKRNPAWAS